MTESTECNQAIEDVIEMLKGLPDGKMDNQSVIKLLRLIQEQSIK
jgi:hypothetical protein